MAVGHCRPANALRARSCLTLPAPSRWKSTIRRQVREPGQGSDEALLRSDGRVPRAASPLSHSDSHRGRRPSNDPCARTARRHAHPGLALHRDKGAEFRAEMRPDKNDSAFAISSLTASFLVRNNRVCHSCVMRARMSASLSSRCALPARASRDSNRSAIARSASRILLR